MKKIILLGLMFLVAILSVSASEDTGYWMDTNGDGYLGGDDLADVYNLNDGLITEFNFNGMSCPVTIWDLNGDGVVNSDDNIISIATEVANTGMYNGVIAGSPGKLTLNYVNGEYVIKVTTDSTLTGFSEVERACVGVDINGEQYFTDENGEVKINNLGAGETIIATMTGNENEQIPYMAVSCSEEICGDGIDQDCDGSDLACPAPTSGGGGGGGGSNHDYVNVPPSVTAGTPTVTGPGGAAVTPAAPTNTNPNAGMNPITGAAVSPPTGNSFTNAVRTFFLGIWNWLVRLFN